MLFAVQQVIEKRPKFTYTPSLWLWHLNFLRRYWDELPQQRFVGSPGYGLHYPKNVSPEEYQTLYAIVDLNFFYYATGFDFVSRDAMQVLRSHSPLLVTQSAGLYLAYRSLYDPTT